ncbi:adenylate/guanylate cyclase domain-containing protein [Paenibacillus thalictri]|uniref:HAMP domain-containing protein n=1 Tax=Paenibacillus thalictri TaxID=2527873 RepID=A0A4Q9DUU3_9BACL|nr:adenylate/guanylate cyclase domain-containing protein [Paenibacillus thalictri]TBL80787.1 HAMP domain-containing protein [Paenibacillus thalictri]
MKTKFSFLLAATILVGVLLFVYSDAWSANPLQREAAYTNISRAITDPQGSVYMVTKSKNTLQKMTSSGDLVYSISSNTDAGPNTVQMFNSIAADDAGNAYVLVTTLDSFGLNVAGERILRISADGSSTSTLYTSATAQKDRLLRVGNIQSLSIKDGSLYFFLKDHNSASLLRLPSAAEAETGAEPQTVTTISMPENRYLNELTGNEQGRFFFTTKKGSLFSVTNGQAKQIYPLGSQNSLNFPIAIYTRDHANVYYIDHHSGAIMRLNAEQPDEPPQSLLTLQTLRSKYADLEWGDFTDVTVANGLITITTADNLVQLLPDGSISTVHSSFYYSWKLLGFKVGYWGLMALMLLLLLLDIRFVYVHLLKRKVSLLVKQLAVIIPVVLMSMIGLSYSVYSSFAGEMRNDTQRQLELLAGNGKYLVNGDNLERLMSPRDYMSGDYQAIKQRINELFSHAGSDRSGLYSTVYRYMNGSLYIVMDDDDSVTMFQPFALSSDNRRVLEQGAVVSGEWEDSSGQWMFALGPLFNSKGEIIGIYETGKDMAGINKMNVQIMTNVLKIISLIGLILLVVITLMTVYLLSSIQKLRRNVNLIASGEWDVKVQIRTRDEVAELGDRFNMMAESIRRYIQEVTKLSESYFRFVPQQFLKVLGRNNMTQVNLGEYQNRTMTILVCNMRQFPEFSGTLTTEENFRFINSFLKKFGPVIREYNGFTSRYLGPGMLTMFPNGSNYAIKAAVKMRATLQDYNDERSRAGYEPIDIGISIHSGDVMIGIIGEEQRMEGSVVSGEVQIALDLEKVSAKLGVTVLLTEETVRECGGRLPGNYRKLGGLQIDNEHKTIELYDLYEADPEHIRKLKHETKQQFETAVELYRNGRFYDAREQFVAVVKKNRYDLTAKLYFFACDEYFQQGVTTGWSSALKIS